MKKTSKFTKKQFGLVAKKSTNAAKPKKTNVKAKLASGATIDLSIQDLGYTLVAKPSKPTLSKSKIDKLFLSPDEK